MEHDLQILDGEFYENERVTVSIDGHVITRKVRWSREAGDLYVVFNYQRFFKCEF